MTQQVDFYVLEQEQESVRLGFACRIAAKAFGQGMQVYLQTENAGQTEKLDQLLWALPPTGFLPHQVHTPDGKIERSTRVMVGEVNPPADWNQILISLTTSLPDKAAQFSRVADLIGGDDEQKQVGRQRFRAYRQLGIEPTTHKI